MRESKRTVRPISASGNGLVGLYSIISTPEEHSILCAPPTKWTSSLEEGILRRRLPPSPLSSTPVMCHCKQGPVPRSGYLAGIKRAEPKVCIKCSSVSSSSNSNGGGQREQSPGLGDDGILLWGTTRHDTTERQEDIATETVLIWRAFLTILSCATV